MYNYWQKRFSTTMQRFNAKIIYIHDGAKENLLSLVRVTGETGMLRTGDVDLNDVIENERQPMLILLIININSS